MKSPEWIAAGRDETYTRLCEAIDQAGRQQETAFLARLCLLLTEDIGDAGRIAALIAEATLPADPSKGPEVS